MDLEWFCLICTQVNVFISYIYIPKALWLKGDTNQLLVWCNTPIQAKIQATQSLRMGSPANIKHWLFLCFITMCDNLSKACADSFAYFTYTYRVQKTARKQHGEGERGRKKNLEASWGATQFHSFMIEWSSIWMSAMWQSRHITVY